MQYNREILFLIWQNKPGGIEVLLPNIINNLPKYKCGAFVFRPLNDGNLSVFKKENITVNYGSNCNILLYIKLYLFLRSKKNAIFHGFNVGPIILFIIRLSKVKNFIYSIHGTVYWKNSFQKYILKTIWRLALHKRFIFTSNSYFSREIFRNRISNKTKIQVIYNPFDINRFVFKKKKENIFNRLKIFYIGRLAKGKNLLKWVEISEKILNLYPDSRFFIYGIGPLHDKLKHLIINKNLEDKVLLKGFVNEVEKAYYENDLLLFLSEYESFGNVAVESILCGTPVIVSRIPSMEEIFKDYPEFLVPLDENLIENIIRKIAQYDRLLSLTQKASIEFRKRFALQNHISFLKRIYESFE